MNTIALLWLVFLFGPPVMAPRPGRGLWRVLQPVHVWRRASKVCASAVVGHRSRYWTCRCRAECDRRSIVVFWVAYTTAGEGDDWVTPGASIVAVATTIAAPVATWVLGESLILRRRR